MRSIRWCERQHQVSARVLRVPERSRALRPAMSERPPLPNTDSSTSPPSARIEPTRCEAPARLFLPSRTTSRACHTVRTMRLRCFAFALALLVAATPAMAVVCELDCDAIAAPPCHHAGVPGDRSLMRSGTHACDHEHRGMSPTLLANANPRGFFAMSMTTPPAMFLHTLVADLSIAAHVAMHGPPGSSPRSTSADTTVLRI
jgi:hypothetical protein